jgi:hypothetical protein
VNVGVRGAMGSRAKPPIDTRELREDVEVWGRTGSRGVGQNALEATLRPKVAVLMRICDRSWNRWMSLMSGATPSMAGLSSQLMSPMSPSQAIIVRPRLTDYHGVSVQQATVDFAATFLDEDIRLYVDPFLLLEEPVADGSVATHVAREFFQPSQLAAAKAATQTQKY